MFRPETPTKKTGLEKAIDSVLIDMNTFTSETEDYAASTDQLVKLYTLKDIDRPKRVSPDTLAIIAGNLFGILVIVGYERANVITSRASNFLLKLR